MAYRRLMQGIGRHESHSHALSGCIIFTGPSEPSSPPAPAHTAPRDVLLAAGCFKVSETLSAYGVIEPNAVRDASDQVHVTFGVIP